MTFAGSDGDRWWPVALALPPAGCSAVLGARLVSKSTLLFCARLGAAGGLLCCSLAFTITGLAGAHSGMGGAPSAPRLTRACPCPSAYRIGWCRR